MQGAQRIVYNGHNMLILKIRRRLLAHHLFEITLDILHNQENPIQFLMLVYFLLILIVLLTLFYNNLFRQDNIHQLGGKYIFFDLRKFPQQDNFSEHLPRLVRRLAEVLNALYSHRLFGYFVGGFEDCAEGANA